MLTRGVTFPHFCGSFNKKGSLKFWKDSTTLPYGIQIFKSRCLHFGWANFFNFLAVLWEGTNRAKASVLHREKFQYEWFLLVFLDTLLHITYQIYWTPCSLIPQPATGARSCCAPSSRPWRSWNHRDVPNRFPSKGCTEGEASSLQEFVQLKVETLFGESAYSEVRYVLCDMMWFLQFIFISDNVNVYPCYLMLSWLLGLGIVIRRNPSWMGLWGYDALLHHFKRKDPEAWHREAVTYLSWCDWVVNAAFDL